MKKPLSLIITLQLENIATFINFLKFGLSKVFFNIISDYYQLITSVLHHIFVETKIHFRML